VKFGCELIIQHIIPYCFYLRKKFEKISKKEKKRVKSIEKKGEKKQKANSTHFLYLWEELCCKGSEC